MDAARLEERAAAREPEPAGLSPALRALWTLARDGWSPAGWDAAHALVQDEAGRDAARVHALLHRAEGDEANARYWYARAGQPPCTEPPDPSSLRAEWRALAAALLAASPSEGTAP